MTTEKTPGSAEEMLRGWFTGRLPEGWFTAPPEIKVDREEITVVGTLADTEGDGSEAEVAAAAEGRSLALPRGNPRPPHRDRPRG